MERDPTELETMKMTEALNIAKADAERINVAERARATIQRQEGEAERRHDHEDWEREMGIRCR